ncbi:Glutaconate CoA-transferase subunit A [bioreactor metagenome]|uniref:Glutaconate CoA-transferase subunit A n=1 Tax=bioreactor metagenome TaxID=1076179 RepID=A0A644WS96_9ZZZZ
MNKVNTLSEAIAKYVHSGDHIATGGFTTSRKPIAAIHEIIRQGQTDFIAEGGPAGSEWDMLIGMGRVKAYINCYTANPRFSNVSRRFRAAIEEGKLLFEDYSQDAQMLMFHAAALGMPYYPCHRMLGSGLETEWGISREQRKKIDKLPDEKFIIQDNPYKPGEKLLLLPVPELDTAIIHVQVASFDGTCRIFGDPYQDIDLAFASKRCIVTCDELISNEEMRKEPNLNSIPGFVVDAVVHVPYGAHPSQCPEYYDYDKKYYFDYDAAGKTEDSFLKFIQEWVYDTENHEGYLNKLGATRLINLKVVPGIGFSKDMTKAGQEAKK